ncbi:hypothetical protein WEU32_07770 [Brevundimonas sp. BH3]|uniref:hypothetical protein n=1 Tax=Brevundimonas sp. BH3 TaxID=3133089 RepID=UPI00324ECF37
MSQAAVTSSSLRCCLGGNTAPFSRKPLEMHDQFIQKRREELVSNIQNYSLVPSSISSREQFASYWSELISIEALEAQARLARSQEQLALSQDAATDAQMAETERQNQIRGRSDEQSYWFRRFLTSLTVAHGVGLVTCLTALMRTPAPQVAAYSAFGIVATFAIGLTLMGILPLSMARIDPRHPDEKKDKNRLSTANWISGVCAFLLALGIIGVSKVAFDTFQYNRTAKTTISAPVPETALPHPPASH